MELVAVDWHFNDEHFTHFTVYVSATREQLKKVPGVAKVSGGKNDIWQVKCDGRYLPREVEANIYEAFIIKDASIDGGGR